MNPETAARTDATQSIVAGDGLRSSGERRSPVRVVVVDAHPLIRAGLRAVVGSVAELELVAESASNKGLTHVVEQTRPDVVLLDIDASEDESLATIGALTAPDSHPLVVALTAASDDEIVVRAVRAGASGVISKDSDEAEIIATLRNVVAGEIAVPPRALSLLAASVRRRVPSSEERRARAQYEALSVRERAVLERVAFGLTGPEIGRLLRITAKTVDTYRHRIREKIGLVHRADYIQFALSIGLLKK
jgi:DNA-binding NarL/FixJ family response regulator